MADVFISFIHEEEAIATAVQAFIREVLGEGVNPFLSSDKWAIYAGERWMDRIETELKGARVIVSMLSEKSVQRPWVNFEAGAAWFSNKPIIPVCFGKLTKGTLPKPYSNLQGLDLHGWDDQHYLVSSIAHYLDLESPLHPMTAMSLGVEGHDELRIPYEALTEFLKIAI